VITIAPGVDIEERDLKERFIRASGPGGQNVNKVATAVELRFDVTRSALPDEVKERLHVLAGNRISDEGVLLIDSRAFRTQLQNREAARERLVALLKKAAIRPKKRRATKPKAGARERRLESKKRRGDIKNLRSSRNDDQ
jgi:ribosome-associated protein